MTRYTLPYQKGPEATAKFDITPLKPPKFTTDSAVPEEEKEKPRGQKRQRDYQKEKNNKAKSQKKEDISIEGDFRSKSSKKSSERRRLRRQEQRKREKICFGCRKQGHNVLECPEAKDKGIGVCFNCGSSEHSLKDCRKLNKNGNKHQFATCFICKETGHLSGQCPKNEKGLYPNGGSCRYCGKVDHLAKDCKLTKEEAGTVAVGKINLNQGADDDDFHIFVAEKQKAVEEEKAERKIEEITKKVEKGIIRKKKVVKF